MIWLIVLLAVAVAMAAVMWVAVGSPPTRPRPDSRFRGATYMSVHRRLQRQQSSQRKVAKPGDDESA